jgi:1-deoxy-D-xylulose-5-phosphate reductoisomerase
MAVEAFLAERLPFADIPAVIEDTLGAADSHAPASIDEVLALDADARRLASARIDRRPPRRNAA